MFELAFIEKCADPGIEIAVVERFIDAVGTVNPLAISITSGNRVILPEPPTTQEDAMRLAGRFVGQATVRVGVTGYPAGHGVSDASELDPHLFDACENIRMGTALFGKVFRVVAHAQGSISGSTFADAVAAWRTGTFDGRYIFGEADPGPFPSAEADLEDMTVDGLPTGEPDPAPQAENSAVDDPNQAGIRVDLSKLPGAE